MGGGEIKERIHNSCRFSRVVWKTFIHRSSSIKKKKSRFTFYFYPEKSTKEWHTWKAVWSQVKSAWRNTYPVTLRLEDLFEISASLFFIYVCVCVFSHSVMSDSFVTWGTVVHPAPLFTGVSRQEYWGGSPFPTSGDLPNPGMESSSLSFPALTGRFFTTAPLGQWLITEI